MGPMYPLVSVAMTYEATWSMMVACTIWTHGSPVRAAATTNDGSHLVQDGGGGDDDVRAPPFMGKGIGGGQSLPLRYPPIQGGLNPEHCRLGVMPVHLRGTQQEIRQCLHIPTSQVLLRVWEPTNSCLGVHGRPTLDSDYVLLGPHGPMQPAVEKPKGANCSTGDSMVGIQKDPNCPLPPCGVTVWHQHQGFKT